MGATKLIGRIGLIAVLGALTIPASAQNDQSGSKTTAECLADETCHKTVLNRVESRMGILEYQAGFPTRSTVERLYDEMDYQRAVLAHQISDNLVSYVTSTVTVAVSKPPLPSLTV